VLDLPERRPKIVRDLLGKDMGSGERWEAEKISSHASLARPQRSLRRRRTEFEASTPAITASAATKLHVANVPHL
jgi:hypothetical protein